ncbi:MAG: hypothetical protein MTP17_04005 [Candidatus Midichloria sp.]|nr:MAG: hypothetical protein MTP17_04005 [Candidatus Midichloria sp.]
MDKFNLFSRMVLGAVLGIFRAVVDIVTFSFSYVTDLIFPQVVDYEAGG